MKKRTKIWLIVAAILSLTGIIMFAITLAAGGWDFSKLNSIKFELNTHYISDDFTDISIDTDTADVIVVRSENDECKVVLHESAKEKHAVGLEGNTLKISIRDDRKWYEHIMLFSFGRTKITVYLPETAYGALKVKQDTGDIKLPSDLAFSAIDLWGSTGEVDVRSTVTGEAKIRRSTGDIDIVGIKVGSLNLTTDTGDIEVSSLVCTDNISIRVSTGDVELENVSCNNFTSMGSTGEISLENATAYGTLRIERSTGDIEFEHSDAASIYIVTDTGDVKGSLKTPKVFFTETDTGNVKIPHTTTGGVCDIKTDTGDIRITIK